MQEGKVRLSNVSIKWMEIQRLIGLVLAGFSHARTTTAASAPCVEAKQGDYKKRNKVPCGLRP